MSTLGTGTLGSGTLGNPGTAETPTGGIPGSGLRHVLRLPRRTPDLTGSTRIRVAIRIDHHGTAEATASNLATIPLSVIRTEHVTTRRRCTARITANGTAQHRASVKSPRARHRGAGYGAQHAPVVLTQRTTKATGNLLALALVAASTTTEQP